MINPLFFFSRHGKTPHNDDGLYRGWSNDPEAQLSPEGRDDAREAGITLKSYGIDFPLIISDDLSRTTETKQIIADILGIKEQFTDKRLRTIDVGDFTGKSKDKYPIKEYSNTPSKKIPGGESFAEFNRRMALAFADVLSIVEKVHKPIVVVGHGANVAFLNNHLSPKPKEKVQYEGLVNPGGVLVFTTDGIIPLTRKRDGAPIPLKDGTSTSGFVTDEENHPPRECWNCRNFVRNVDSLGGCTHIVVRFDPKLQDRKQADNTIAIGDRDCCDNFRSHIST